MRCIPAAIASLVRGFTRAVPALAVAAWCCGAALAQDYPNHPVRIIVPFAAGGPADVYARFLGQRLQEALGQPFVVDDRPGGGSVVGTDAAAKSAPDGYTLLLMSNTHTVNESLMPNKPFALSRDFVPVAPINYSDLVMVVHPSVAAKSVAEFIALAKTQPGKLNYASSGPGTPYHMAGELFKAMAGVDIVHVPYRGSSGARTDTIERQDALDGAPRRTDGGGDRARLRSDDLARDSGSQRHAAGDRHPPERGDHQDRKPARRTPRLGGARGGRNDHDARRVRQVHLRRHREVGAHRQDLGR